MLWNIHKTIIELPDIFIYEFKRFTNYPGNSSFTRKGQLVSKGKSELEETLSSAGNATCAQLWGMIQETDTLRGKFPDKAAEIPLTFVLSANAD